MAPPKRTAFSNIFGVLTMILILVCSATADIDQNRKTVGIPRQVRPTYVDEKGATTERFLRSGGTGGDVVNEEERGLISYLLSKIGVTSLTVLQRGHLKLESTPEAVLKLYREVGIRPTKDILLDWMKYVLKYRANVDGIIADDTYVISTLKRFIPERDIPRVFKAMKKKTQLRRFGNDLETAWMKSIKEEQKRLELVAS